MKRRAFLGSLTAVGLVVAIPTWAQTAQDQIVRQLQRQGYGRIRISRTWLGRTRIVATGRQGTREIILNPATGAILRDYLDRDDRSGGGSSDDDSSDSRSRFSDDDDRDDRDDGDDRDDDRGDDDDDDDNDNSGSGSSNSGHGSDNSGSGHGGGGDDDDDD
ncbi:hypothetical protein ACOXXX_03995 [Thalassococcus sp. BH17M4-6]|uniref:hypothetical protein n=1 Tax=Thalassococcus sp. BH17M4-6 TaxID=3413148 RepID=UPI003BDDD52D